jgi:hypothetical protein
MAATTGSARHLEGGRTLFAAVTLLLCVVPAACAPRELRQRAERAQGGAVHGLIRIVDARVLQGFPGDWRWRTVYQTPERYAWTIQRLDGRDHYTFDGETARAFAGDAVVSATREQAAPLRTLARFFSVVLLHALARPDVQVTPLAADALAPGVAWGLDVRFPDGTRHRLGFDAADRVVWAMGPIELPPLPPAEASVRFDDFRPAGGFELPYHAVWTLGGQPLADERVVAMCPNPPGLDVESFRSPGAMPPCGDLSNEDRASAPHPAPAIVMPTSSPGMPRRWMRAALPPS